MRAIQLTAYGNPVEALKYVDIPGPEAPGRTTYVNLKPGEWVVTGIGGVLQSGGG